MHAPRAYFVQKWKNTSFQYVGGGGGYSREV